MTTRFRIELYANGEQIFRKYYSSNIVLELVSLLHYFQQQYQENPLPQKYPLVVHVTDLIDSNIYELKISDLLNLKDYSDLDLSKSPFYEMGFKFVCKDGRHMKEPERTLLQLELMTTDVYEICDWEVNNKGLWGFRGATFSCCEKNRYVKNGAPFTYFLEAQKTLTREYGGECKKVILNHITNLLGDFGDNIMPHRKPTWIPTTNYNILDPACIYRDKYMWILVYPQPNNVYKLAILPRPFATNHMVKEFTFAYRKPLNEIREHIMEVGAIVKNPEQYREKVNRIIELICQI